MTSCPSWRHPVPREFHGASWACTELRTGRPKGLYPKMCTLEVQLEAMDWMLSLFFLRGGVQSSTVSWFLNWLRISGAQDLGFQTKDVLGGL